MSLGRPFAINFARAGQSAECSRASAAAPPARGCAFVPRLLRTIAGLMCAALLLAAPAERVWAQTIITVDPASAVEAASSSIAMNHTVGSGANRLLIVSVAIERNDATVSAVTYAGQPLSFLGRLTDPGVGATQELWGRLAPNSGTNQVVVTLNNSAAVVVGAVSFANVDQTNAIAAGQLFSSSGGTTASGSIASAANQLVLATLAANDEVGSVTAGAGQTARWNVVNAADVIGAASTRTGNAASTTMSYTFTNPGRWVLGIIALRPATEVFVTNTNDSGEGSLRSAVQFANAQSGILAIKFGIPGAGPHTITLATVLPDITNNGLTIDGTTQSGTQCRDLWTGAGHDLRVNVRGSSGFDGFRLGGANQTIRGLSVTGFANAIRTLPGSSAATVQCNYLGLLANGTSSGNSRGAVLEGAGGRIGGLDAGQGNVISANSIVGVVSFAGSTDTAIRGNFIGTDAAGANARANGTGINNFNGTATWRDITRNLIAGNNGNAGIVLEPDDRISPSDGQIRIQRNVIGFTRTLSALMKNGGDGIRFPSGSISAVLIGGDASTEGNTVTGTDHGISLNNSSNIVIRGNTIARAGQIGILVDNANGVTIGGASAGQGNAIGGNGGNAILAANGAANITILGNLIQPVSIAGGTFANSGNGVSLFNASNVVIGDGTAGGRNVIGGNMGRAIEASLNVTGLTINGNYLGTDATGNVAVSNAQNRDFFTRDAIGFGNGTFGGVNIRNNIIGGHAGAMIEFWDSTVADAVIQGNSLGVGVSGASLIPADAIEPLIFAGGPTRQYSNILIGGLGAGEGNIIANGANSGIRMESTGSNIQVIGNTIRNNAFHGISLYNNSRAAFVGNRVFANGELGIELDDDGVTANDPGDADNGSNDLLNFPQAIRAVVVSPGQLRYTLTLDAPAAANGYRIDFFASTAADPSGHGEGERYLGAADIAHAGGALSYTGTLTTLEPVSIGDAISATTTRRTGSGTWDITSEFSAVATADGVAALTVAMSSDVFDPPAANPFATPGNDIVLITTISNIGNGSTDANSIFAVISIDPANSFLNAATPAWGGIVQFTSNSPGLTFDPATALRFSNSVAPPANVGQCNYTPVAGYDPQVRHVCVSPSGSLPSGLPQGQFAVRLRAKIN